MGLSTILVVIAVVLFVAAALNIGSDRVSLGWAGLAFWAASTLV